MKYSIFRSEEQFIVPILEECKKLSDKSESDSKLQKRNDFIEKYKSLNYKQVRFITLSPEQVQIQLYKVKQITFEITDACNLNCKYCAYGDLYNDYDKRKEKSMDSKVAKTLLNYLVDFWNLPSNTSFKKEITISFYGGEPLLNMSFIKEIVAHCENLKLKYNSFVFSLTTNALLLYKNIDFFVSKNFDLLVSLDGDRINNSYRVFRNNKESFDQVIRNLKLTKSRYPDYFKKHIHFNSVIHNRNSIAGIYSFFKSNFDKFPSVGELNNSGIKPEMFEKFKKMYKNSTQSLKSTNERKKIQNEMFLKFNNVQNLGIFLKEFSGNIYSSYLDLLVDRQVINRLPTGTCLPFSKKMFITVNGKILPCERVGHNFMLGTVNNNSVSIDFEDIAKKYNNYFQSIINQCIACENKMACKQCIFQIEKLETHPICYGFMNKKKLDSYINNMISIIKEDTSLYSKILNSTTTI